MTELDNFAQQRRRMLKISAASLVFPGISACSGADVVADPEVPRSAFDENSTAEQVTKGVDLKGKIAVVTGCTSGIGLETMRVLALRGAYVVGTSRSLAKAQAACKSVRGVTTPVALELGDLESVVACADAIRSLNSPIDILVCNAGFRGGGNRRVQINGVEKHFAVNHLGHFVLVNRLLDRLYLAWQGRIVVVASRSAYRDAPQAGIEFDNLDAHRDYSDARAYAQSKLANVLYALELGKLLRGTRITANALHPGLVNTDIDRNLNAFTRFGFGLLAQISGKNVAEGAATSCYVATSPLLGSTSGRYFEDCNAVLVETDRHMRNMALADELWQASEKMTKDYLVSYDRPDWNEFKNGLRKKKAS